MPCYSSKIQLIYSLYYEKPKISYVSRTDNGKMCSTTCLFGRTGRRRMCVCGYIISHRPRFRAFGDFLRWKSFAGGHMMFLGRFNQVRFQFSADRDQSFHFTRPVRNNIYKHVDNVIITSYLIIYTVCFICPAHPYNRTLYTQARVAYTRSLDLKSWSRYPQKSISDEPSQF